MPGIVVAVDFSDVTAELVAAASKHACIGAKSIALVHVAPPAAGLSMGEAASDIPPQAIEELINARRDELRAVSETFDSSIVVEPVLLQGDAVEGVLETARQRNAELIILGSHGHGRLYDLLVGSVANGVIRHAPCPVLVVPAKKN